MDPPDWYITFTNPTKPAKHKKPTKSKNAKISSLGIGCVLEYMSFERRSQIATKCPRIRGIEKSTPMNLEKLCFEYDGFTVDATKYVIKPKLWENDNWYEQMRQEVLPGDLPLPYPEDWYRNRDLGDQEPPFPQEFILKIKKDKDEQCYILNKDYKNLLLHLAQKKFASKLFGKNRKIYTGLLEFDNSFHDNPSAIYRLPDGLKIYPVKVKTHGEPLDQLRKILAPNHRIQIFSLPLQGVETDIYGHPLVSNSKKLELHSTTFNDLESYLQFMNRLSNRKMDIGFEIFRGDFPEYIRRGITVPLKVGTEFSWILRDPEMSETLLSLKKEFQGFAIRGPVGDERFQDTVYCIAIPRHNGDTELQLLQKLRRRPKYAENPDMHLHDNEVQMRVVRRGTSIPTEVDSVECALRRKKRLQMIKSPFYFIGDIIISLLSVLAIFVMVPPAFALILWEKIPIWAKDFWNFFRKTICDIFSRKLIATQCSTLREMEKSLPMNLEKLCFDYDSVTVNTTKYSITSESWQTMAWCNEMSQEVLPGDVLLSFAQIPKFWHQKRDMGSLKPPFTPKLVLEIKKDSIIRRLNNEHCYSLKKDYTNLPLHLAKKKFATELFGTNRKIYTELLEFDNQYENIPMIYRLPEGLEIYPTKVKTRGEPLDPLYQILAPSHPIQTFSLPLNRRPDIYQHPLVLSSKKLELYNCFHSNLELYVEFKNQIPNRKIDVAFEILSEQLPVLIRSGITVPLKVGTEVSWILWDPEMSEKLYSLKNELQGFAIRGDKADERFQDTVYCIAIPRNDGKTELEILQKIRIRPKYAKNPDRRLHDNEIRMRVVPRGTSIPAEVDSVECALRRKKRLKIIKSPFYLIGGIIISFLAILALLIIIPVLGIVYFLYKIPEWAKITWNSSQKQNL
ncbi:hypothetical protein B9Z55_008014 [Caenorhabditis nigoni]|uniref:Uncharacterized protein n=1 Tax=Caenorhabditis nigoni TaxID=1611254 RepID=A0A2G5VC86_9PELO|nr:hypothetical protein B9Z55_008014 [Caenorhabditis nigoni]